MQAARVARAAAGDDVTAHTGMRAYGIKGLASPEHAALTAAALWIVYHVQCELYDESVCTGQQAHDGSGVMPRNTTEMGIISRHANGVGALLLERARRLGLSIAMVEAAETFVQRMPYGRVLRDHSAALRLIGGTFK